jgi:hypothetical protein
MLKRLAAIVAVPILSMIAVTTVAAGHENSAPPLSDRVTVQYTVQQESACGRDPATGFVTCCGQGRTVC